MWIYWEPIRNFLFSWQSLAGAFIGAATPLLVLFISNATQKKATHKKDLILLEKYLVLSSNQAVDARETVEIFLKNQLTNLERNIQKRISTNSYSLDTTFFPLFNVHSFDSSIYSINSESNYIDNLVLQVYKMSRDLASSVDDIRDQFHKTTEMNKQINFIKLIPPGANNQNYLDNIKDIKIVIQSTLLDKNFRIYITTLSKATQALQLLNRIGISRWRRIFSSKGKFFFSRKSQLEYDSKVAERIELYIQKSLITPSPNTQQK